MELTINIDKDFFELNPFMKYESPFNKLSSKENWALFLLYHPDSPKAALRQEDKELEIAEHFLGDIHYNFEKLKEYKDDYKKLHLTKAQRELMAWNEKLEERAKFLERVQYTVKDAKVLDEMLLQSKAIWDGYKKIYDAFQ